MNVNLTEIDTLIVDGYVYSNDEQRPGLGAYLYNALSQTIPVIGLVKRKFYNTEKVTVAVKRRSNGQPLFVTAIGTDVREAALLIQNMEGDYRMPALLKQLDAVTRR